MVTAAPESVPRWTRQHWSFIAVMLVPAATLALARWHALPTAGLMARHMSLAATPAGLRHTIIDILFVPIGALVVVVVRLTLGIRLLGPFRSILLAFAFLTTGIALGLIFLTVTVAILVAARPAIAALRLPYFGRVSVMISAVALVMIVGTLAGSWLQAPSLRNVAHFPIVVLVLVGEKVAVTIRREGVRSGVWRAAATALVGVAVTALASIPGLDGVLLSHPELLLVEMCAVVVVSTSCTWRLLSRCNPGPRPAAANRPAASRRPIPTLAGGPKP